MHAGGDPPGRRGDAGDARLPGVGRQLLRPAAHRAGRHPPDRGLHQHQLLDARRRRAARRLPRRRRGRRGRLRHRLRVPRRLRHRADGLDRRALLRPAGGGRGAATAIEQLRGRRRGAAREGAGEAAAGRDDAPMAHELETRVLLEHAEDPALRTIDGYKGYGGYATLEKAYREMEADEVLKELEDSGLRGRGGAGFSMGKKASFLPRGEMAKYLCCNADESEPGAFKDRELMQRNPHQLIEGIAIAALAADAGHAFIFIRGEYDSQADILDAAVAEAYEAGYLGEDILGTPPRPRAGRPPRRRRLHLRRGDGAARRARGQARQPAAEAAVPGGPGPLRRADADQQRRDALQRAADRRQRRRVVQGLRHRAVAGDQGRLDLRRRAAARQLRGRAGDPDPRADLRPRRRPRARATRSRPSTRRLLLAGAHRRGGLDLPYSFEAMAEAGSMLGSGSIIVADDRVSIPHMALRTARFYHHESCGKCTPCREGTNWTVKMLERVVRGEATPMDLDIISLGPGEHHRPLPLRARRLDGDAGRRRWSASSATSSRK